MKVLITGFEPFGGDAENPSRLAGRAAAAQLKAEGVDASFIEVPCVFATAAPTVVSEAQRIEADIVICCGLAAKRTAMSLETTARNIIDARIPDNAGDQPRNQPVVADGPPTIPTRLPVAAAKTAIISAHIPAEISPDAGEYVCNTLMYATLAALPEDKSVGFVHVPLFSKVSLEKQAEAIAIVAKEAIAARDRLYKAQGVAGSHPTATPTTANGLAN